jgi:hypothetical protein
LQASKEPTPRPSPNTNITVLHHHGFDTCSFRKNLKKLAGMIGWKTDRPKNTGSRFPA